MIEGTLGKYRGTASSRAMTQVTCSGGSRENSVARVEQASKQARETEIVRR